LQLGLLQRGRRTLWCMEVVSILFAYVPPLNVLEFSKGYRDLTENTTTKYYNILLCTNIFHVTRYSVLAACKLLLWKLHSCVDCVTGVMGMKKKPVHRFPTKQISKIKYKFNCPTLGPQIWLTVSADWWSAEIVTGKK